MGALHEGHLSLVRQAKQECETVFVSVFVNPTQFGPNEDFARYPRDEERDTTLAKSAGCDVLFVPSVEEMYPTDDIRIVIKGVTDCFEGSLRPGHFDGVATVVAKLFGIIAPDRAFFGEKDFQQCAVIRAMVAGLNMDIDFRSLPTIRESDGLALSSRNRYLTPDQRAVAPLLYSVLSRIRIQVLNLDHKDSSSVGVLLSNGISELSDAGFQVDYLERVDPLSMQLQHDPNKSGRLIVAARIGSVRLIDNL